MAQSDPYLLFMGAGGVNPVQNAAMQTSIARLAMDQKTRNIQDQQQQIALQEAQRQQQAQQIISDALKDWYKNPQPQTMTPDQVAAQGGSAAAPTGTNPDTGRPTLAGTNATEGRPVQPDESVPVDSGTPQSISTSANVPPMPPQTVLPGSPGLPDYTVPQGQTYTQAAEPAPNAQPMAAGTWENDTPEDLSSSIATQPVSEMASPEPPAPPAPSPAPIPASAPPSSPSPAPVQQPPMQHPASAVSWVPTVRDKLIAAGYGPEALQFERNMGKLVNDTVEATAKRQESEVKAEIARHGLLDNALSSFIEATPDSQKAAQWSSFIQNQIRSGHTTPQEITQLGLDQYPGTAQLPALHTLLKGSEQMLKYARDQAELNKLNQETSPDAQAKKKADLEKAQAEAAEKLREADAAALSTAARQGQPAYAAAYAKVPGDRRSVFTPPEEYDAKRTPEDTMLAGMNNQQKATYFEHQTAEADRKANQELMRQQAADSLALRRAEFEDRRAREGQVSKAAFTQASAELERLQKQQRDIWPERAALGAQLTRAGNNQDFMMVDRFGKPTGQPIKAILKDPAHDPTFVGMKERYDDLTVKAQQIQEDKEDLLRRVGAMPPAPIVGTPPPVAPAQPNTTPQTPAPKATAAPKPIAVPAEIQAGLKPGVPRKVNSPNGQITIVLKPDGKVYQQ